MTVRDLNTMRAVRTHLAAQVAAGSDTKFATLAEATTTLAEVEERIEELETELRKDKANDYLFAGQRKRLRVGRDDGGAK